MSQYIIDLDIPMQVALRMHDLKPTDNIRQHPASIIQRVDFIRLFSHVLLEIAPVTVLHEDVNVLLRDEAIVQFHYVLAL